MKSFFRVILLSFALSFAFTACENPIGLGSKINTEKPVIRNAGEENQPGSFIQGDGNRIWLEVEQKFGVAEVYMEVEYINKETGEVERKRIDAYYDEERKQWYVDLDTSGMEDGTIKAWVTAVDISGNTSTTTDIVYFVKNTPPQIKLNMPLVESANFDDDVFLNSLKDTDPLYLGFELLGLAEDNYGIEEGYPKIMIWPADLTDVDADGIPLSSNGRYGMWRSLVVPNARSGLTATKFSWPMQQLIPDSAAPGGYRLPKGDEPRVSLLQGTYRIRIVTKDLFGNENYYPNRTDNKRGPGGQAVNPDAILKKYIEINYIASSIPIVQVTSCPSYYNGASIFEARFLVSCSNPLASSNPVEVYITDGNDGSETIIGGPYYPPQGTYVSPYNFTLTINAAQADDWVGAYEGTLYLRLKATDDGDKDGPPTYQHFNYDITPPKVPIDRPVNLTNKKKSGDLKGGSYEILYPASDEPKWVTGSVTVGGINTDNNGIKEVWYHIGKIGGDAAELAASSTFYDGVSWSDTKLNTSSPAAGWGGSVYAWTYTATYPIGYKTSNSGTIQEFIDLSGYSGTNSDTVSKERFYLPFYVKVVDNAGNYHIVHYKLCIDPLLDEPQVTITYPQEGSKVGGTVRLSGLATDNYWMHTVLIRVKTVDGTYPLGTTTSGGYYLPATTPPTTLFYTDPLYSSYPKPNGSDSAGWFKANKTGDDVTVNWSYSINQDGGLNPTVGDLKDVLIEVVAIDTNEISHQTPHITGPIAKLNVQFSSKVPTIVNEKIIKTNNDPKELAPVGTKTSGKFDLSMDISAVTGFYNVKARINNAPPDINIITNGSPQSGGSTWSITSLPPDGDKVKSTLKFTVDSTAGGLIPAIPYGTTGTMTLELTVEDSTENHFSTTGTWNIGIDNFYPTAKIETSRIAYENEAESKYFLVEGTAQDWGSGSGNIQGLERVLVYFETAKITYPSSVRTVEGTGTYLRPSTGGTAPGSDFVTYPDILDTNISYTPGRPNVTSFTTFPKIEFAGSVYKSNAAMVIDYAENDPTKDYDGDGTKGEMWNGLLDKAWGARMETTKFSDGPYIVHYIVMDQAGNATHYQKDIFIENNKPKIKSINIGTDIDFNSTLTPWVSKSSPGEFRQDAYMIDLSSEGRGTIVTSPASFRIRNNMFGLRLTLEGGNINKHIIAAYVTRSGSTMAATAMQRGRVYEIATNAQTTDFTKYGAPNNYVGTVFVASGEGEGTGAVYQYTTASTNSTQYFENLGSGAITETVIFNKFIPDVADGDTRQFVIKVYDSALSNPLHGNPTEYDQLAHALLLTVAVNNNDTVAPTISVADFGQKYVTSIIDNPTDDTKKTLTALADAVYSDYVETTGTTKNGYVQYQAHSTPNTSANISGKVIFNGKAADNHRIQKITVQIPGYNNGAELDIAVRNATGLLERANYIAGEREFRIVYPEVPQFSLEYGHALTWQFMWDSSKITTVAASNVDITFRVYDRETGSLSDFKVKNVNIIPYISEITTPLSGAYASAPSAFNRSALGGYPVREGDSITIKGFNLGRTTAPAVNPTVTIGGAAFTGTLAANGTISGSIGTANTVVSGPLVVTVSSVASFNNSSNKTASYNQEPNNVNNNVLDNSRYIYVWRTGYLLNERVITNPFFRMDPKTAARYLTFGYYGTQGEMRIQINNGDGRAWNNTTTRGLQLNTIQNRYISTTVAVGSSGEFYAASSNQTQGGHPFALYTANRPYSGMTNGTAAPTVTVNRLVVPSDPGRINIPRIYARDTTDTSGVPRILMSYYDNNTSNVVLRYGTRASNSGAITTGAGFNDLNSNTTVATSANGQTVSTTAYRGSDYTAVGALYNGRPVLAWYDETNNNLVFARGNAVVATYSNNVTLNYTIIPNPDGTSGTGNYKGSHVDLAVDASDNVHLAYYDAANGGLYYLLIPATGTQANRDLTVTNLRPVRVDTYLAVGTKIMLNLRNDTVNSASQTVPYITYFHGSFVQTRNSIRVAWQKNFPVANGTDDNDRFTGAWEVMTVPAQNVPVSNEMICNGVPTAITNWQDTGLTRGTTDLTKSIVVGYMTNQNYEGAILKDNMTAGIAGK
jgi:hypothetical protein